MKKGDWVITEEGELGKIVDESSRYGWYFVALDSQAFSSIRSGKSLIKFDPAVADILNAIGTVPNTNERK